MRSGEDRDVIKVRCWVALYVLATVVVGVLAGGTNVDPEPRPSSVVGGMGMPGKTGAGSKWIREEGTQDER